MQAQGRVRHSGWLLSFQIPFEDFFTAEFQGTGFKFLLQIESIEVDMFQDWEETWSMIVQSQ